MQITKLKQYIQSLKQYEFIRFAIVGTIATCIHYGTYLLFSWLFQIEQDNTTLLNAVYTIGYIISWFCNFYLTAHFTFKTNTSVKRGIGFALSHIVNYLLHIIFLNVFLWLNVPEKWAPIPVFCIVIPINFLLVRYVFTSKQFKN